MIIKILKDIAYTYFPKGICNIEQREIYLKSIEYQRLRTITSNFFNNDELKVCHDALFFEFSKHPLLSNIQDISLLHWDDRCLTFEIEIIEKNILSKIHLNISLLIPFYIIYILENKIQLEPYQWLTLPQLSSTKEMMYKEHIYSMSNIVEDITKYRPFPKELVNIIIPDLCFKDIRFGNFTLYNAFFLDNNYFNQSNI